MRVASIAAGAAGMYCGTCIHDNTLAAALQRAGHDVALLPLYTPMRTDETNVSLRQVFYGAVNVYLQQKSGLFRHTPRLFDRLLDRPALLNQVSRLAASTDAAELGELTLSVLRAQDGKQVKELERLITWLEEFRPQVVQIAYSMLLGIGVEIKRRLGVPIVCGLTGEDLFLDYLPEPHRSRVAEAMRDKARHADAFVATSHYYAGQMREFLGIEADRMHVVHLGINLNFVGTNHLERDISEPLIIGYMARICPEKGLHILLEAFQLLLASRPEANLKLKVAGYVGPRDEPYLAEQRRRISDWGLGEQIEILGEVDLEGKRKLLSTAAIVSVPTTYREPKGLFVLEALAHGVPVVQPAHGAFPELMKATGGGLLVEPDSPESLAEGLRRLVDNPEERLAMGRRGSLAVRERFNSDKMAERTMEIYRKVVGGET